jgi:single-stranded-DNA-specific exonuclease
MPYEWSMYPTTDIDPKIIELSKGDGLQARLLVNRGVTNPNLAKYFFDLTGLSFTSALEIPEMDKAFARVKEAIDEKQKIVVFGDYDVDGTSSVALLYRAFGFLGIKIDYYIPNRFHEGYGLNKEAVYKIKNNLKADLLITCDCGISNFDEVDYANTLGLDVIITDHHSIPQNPPPSIANCNPKTLNAEHPLHFLPGVGVAYELACLILDEFLDDSEAYKKDLLDLVALGMVADLAPLKSENRFLTLRGLEVLSKTTKVGLRELLKISGVAVDPDAEHIGFGLAPRINSVGRLNDAQTAVRLMITDDEDEAVELAQELDLSNRERQVLCTEIFDSAFMKIQEKPEILKNNVIVLADASWHHGVVGIVASRLIEQFHLPVFMIAVEGEMAKASVRSIDVNDLDLFKEMQEIQKKTNLFEKFGGHQMAAGFSVKSSNLEALIDAINEHFKEKLKDLNLNKKVKIDTALKLTEVSETLVSRINKLAPFGIANPSPKFVIGPLLIARTKSLGKDGKHLKLFVQEPNNNRLVEAVIWNRAEEFLDEFGVGDSLVFAFSPRINDFMSMKSIQLDIKDWHKPEDLDMDIFFARFRKKVEA